MVVRFVKNFHIIETFTKLLCVSFPFRKDANGVLRLLVKEELYTSCAATVIRKLDAICTYNVTDF